MNRPRYDEPFHWWGPGWETASNRGIVDLLRDGTIDPETGAVLWSALSRRSSLTVAAGPSGAGKTTLLTALLDFLPPGTRRIYLRGSFESFTFLADSTVVPGKTVLLVNEISPHLPIYAWGPAVVRALDLTRQGFSLMATAHADSIAEFVGLVTGSPLRIPAPHVAAFQYVVFLDRADEAPSGRRVREVSRLTPTARGLAIESLPPRSSSPRSDESTAPAPIAPQWFPVDELNERRQILEDLRGGHIGALPGGSPTP